MDTSKSKKSRENIKSRTPKNSSNKGSKSFQLLDSKKAKRISKQQQLRDSVLVSKNNNRNSENDENENEKSILTTTNTSITITKPIITETPSSLRVLEFAGHRNREISIFLKAMSQFSGQKRVFQRLPRHLRRRAMSHNIHLLPKRIRGQAAKETENDPPKATKKNFRGLKRKRLRTFVLSQNSITDLNKSLFSEKKWLETHLWMVKRMKMQTLWGHRIAISSNQKILRPAYKASLHSATLYDASWTQILILRCKKGEGDQQKSMIELFHSTGLINPISSTLELEPWVSGTHRGQSILLDPEPNDDEFENNRLHHSATVGPISWLWRFKGGKSKKEREIIEMETKKVSKPNTKFTEFSRTKLIIKKRPKSKSMSDTHNNEKKEASLWIWIHPSIVDQAEKLFEGLFNVERLETNSICKFELRGPQSHSILQRVLKIPSKADNPHYSSGQSSSFRVWKGLSGLRSAAGLSPNVALNLSVIDPRLTPLPAIRPSAIHFRPPTLNSRVIHTSKTASALDSLLANWPDDAVDNKSRIWSKEGRAQMESDQEPESKINSRREEEKRERHREKKRERRRKQRLKQMEIEKDEEDEEDEGDDEEAYDSIVDILLIQACNRNGGKSSKNELGYGWDIFVPRGWAMAFWRALASTNALAIGLKERSYLLFEQGQPSFPFDWPDTKAGSQWALLQSNVERTAWLRRPPAKRINYLAVSTPTPFLPDWSALHKFSSKDEDEDEEDEKDENEDEGDIISVLREPKLVNRALSLASQYLTANLNEEEAAYYFAHCKLIRVAVVMLPRGKPMKNALICLANDNDYQLWQQKREDPNNLKLQRAVIREKPNKSQLSQLCRRVVGYTYAGGFSYARARGVGYAYVSFSAFCGEYARQQIARVVPGFCLLKNPNSSSYTPAQLFPLT